MTPVDETFVREATSIADRLVAAAISARGETTWLMRQGADADPEHRPVLTSLDGSLYAGTAGVALFLGAAYAVTGQREYRRSSLGAIEHAVRRMRASLASPTDGSASTRLGFHSGAPGVAWAAEELSRLLDEPRLGRQARLLLHELILAPDAPHEHDVNLGSAGCIPVLLQFGEKGMEGALPFAERLGDGLIEAATRAPEGWSWPSLRSGWPRNLTGLSHGASGIGAALASLHAATGREDVREAAMQAFAYERAHFNVEQGNWPDFRHRRSDGWRYLCFWCHGAAGIGLARAHAARLFRDAELRREAEVAAKTTAAALERQLCNPGWNTILCHGSLGNAECLDQLGRFLGEDTGALRRAAAHGVGLFGAAASAACGYRIEWPTDSPNGLHPPLMTGATGVGHALLRCAAPGRVPDILGAPLAMT